MEEATNSAQAPVNKALAAMANLTPATTPTPLVVVALKIHLDPISPAAQQAM